MRLRAADGLTVIRVRNSKRALQLKSKAVLVDVEDALVRVVACASIVRGVYGSVKLQWDITHCVFSVTRGASLAAWRHATPRKRDTECSSVCCAGHLHCRRSEAAFQDRVEIVETAVHSF